MESESPEQLSANSLPAVKTGDGKLSDDGDESQTPAVSIIPIDHELIRDYMRLKVTNQTARLAAAMAPKPDEFDPAVLIDRALALQMGVEAGVIRQRKAMVERMSYLTLGVLLMQLGLEIQELFEQNTEHDAKLDDPVVGPVLRRYRQFTPPAHYHADYERNEWIADTLRKADLRTELPRPSLPCSLEVALRYSANAPSASWKSLEMAYLDSLDLSATLASNGREMAFLKGDTQSKAFKLPLKSTTILPFLPGIDSESSAIISAELIDSLLPCKTDSETGNIFSEPQLAILASHFYTHWQNMAASYEDRERLFKAKGREGAPTRDRQMWIDRTGDFIESLDLQEFLSRESRLQTRNFFTSAVGHFLAAYSKNGTKSPSAKKKASKFLVTLFTHRDKAMTPPTLQKFKEILSNSAIKSMSDQIILECHQRLKSKLDQGRAASPKKK